MWFCMFVLSLVWQADDKKTAEHGMETSTDQAMW